MALGAAAGCAVGQGSPDGWRYLRSGPVAVAHPKTWQRTPTGAALRLPGGRTDAQLTVGTVSTVATAAGTGHGAPPPPPHAARRETLRIDGRSARVLSYLSPAPDGRPATWVDVTLQTRDGRPVEVRAWTLNGRTVRTASGHGTADGRLLLREIVDSIELD